MPDAAPRAATRAVDLAGGDAVHVGLHDPANRARSMRRRSRMEGKKLPLRNLGIRSSTSPALVVSRRWRLPLRWVVRVSVRS